MGPTYEPANGINDIGRELINSPSIPRPTGFRCSSEIRGQRQAAGLRGNLEHTFYTVYLVFLEFRAIVE